MKDIIRKFGFIPVAFFVVLTILFSILSYSAVNNSTYEYYEEQYSTCVSGYTKCKTLANSSTNYYTKAVYEQLADKYEDLMGDWDERMEKYEVRSTVFGILAGGTGFLFLASGTLYVLFLVKFKKATAVVEAPVVETPAEEVVEEVAEEVVAEEVAEATAEEVVEEVVAEATTQE